MVTHNAHTPADIETPDSWHTHVHEAPAQEEHGQIDGWKIFIVAMSGYILTVAVVVVLCVYYFAAVNSSKVHREEFPEKFQSEDDATKAKIVGVQVPALVKRDQILHGDLDKGMTMDKAMDKVVNDARR